MAKRFIIETIRRQENLGDISLALYRPDPNLAPTYIYEIHNDNGIIKTCKRDLSNFRPDRWVDQFTVGEGKTCSIEFNGHWVKESNNKYKLATEEKPYIFWTDNSNTLWCQIWNDETSKIQLATDVIKLASIRGWKNVYMWNHDQGLIVAYIKTDGLVYYRNYCKQPPDQPAIWETERVISELPSPAQNIALFRTNDYRTGFMCESNNITYWTLTFRDWSGMALPIETVTVSPMSVQIDFVEIAYKSAYENENITVVPIDIGIDLGYVLTDNYFVEIYNQSVTINDTTDWGKVLIFRTEHGLYNLDASDFEIVDSYNRIYSPNTIEKIGDRTYKLSFFDINNFNNVDKVGTLKFKGLVVTNGEGVLYLPFEKTFSPINLVPTFIPLPEVEAIWNE